MRRIYFDHNATTPLGTAARAEMQRVLADGLAFGNPSSIHGEGRAARELVEASRRQVASALGGRAEDLLWTSGGTEADCLGVIGLSRLARDRGAAPIVVTTELEHPAALGAARHLATEGFEIRYVAVNGDGVIAADALAEACAGGAALVTLQLANHEVGTVQDVRGLAERAHAAGALVHCDAVQAFGKVDLDVAELGVDAVAVSAHKIGGPKGVGALWLRREHHDLGAVVAAGHQERGRRPGTENVLGVVGFGAAAASLSKEATAGARQLCERLETGVRGIDGATVHGAAAPRVGNTLCASFDGAPGEVLVCALDLEGIAVSTGAACTSGSVEPSAVLLAMGVARTRAGEAVRFSLGAGNTAAEVDVLLELLPGIIARARAFS
jgi:cysteine desulfurase